MIKINLLKAVTGASGKPDEVVSETSVESNKGIFLLLGLPLMMIIADYSLKKVAENKLLKVRVNIDKLGQELMNLQEQSAESLVLAVQKKGLEKKFTEVKDILEGRFDAIKAIDSLQSFLPDQTWFEKITLSGEELKLTGTSASADEIAIFLKALNESLFFKKVRVEKIEEIEKESGNMHNFRIKCKVGS